MLRMLRTALIGGVAVLGVSITAGMASAQCAFQHPAKAKELKTSLVQAFVPCDTPNSNTQTGVPSCDPPQTYDEAAGSPLGGWRWGGNSRAWVRVLEDFVRDAVRRHVQAPPT